MATYTENYNFTLPQDTDAFNITDYNNNFEAVDNLMAETEATVNEVNNKIGTSDNNETIFSLLKNSGSILKSIQHVVYTNPQGETKGSVSFNTIDLSKTIVIFERLTDLSNYSASNFNYTLNDSSIDITHNAYNNGILKFGFWIIEFN